MSDLDEAKRLLEKIADSNKTKLGSTLRLCGTGSVASRRKASALHPSNGVDAILPKSHVRLRSCLS